MPGSLRVLLIAPDQQLHDQLTAALTNNLNIEIAKSLHAFPQLDDLLRTIRVQKPDFLIADVGDLPKIESLLGSLDDLVPGLAIVAVADHLDEERAHRLMHLGIREYIVPPFTQEKIFEMLAFLRQQSQKHPLPAAHLADLYTFFPAKPGVGATTIALSTSCVLADEFSVRTLLLDCDLAAGIVNFHLDLGNSASIIDALNHAENLDEDLWRQMVGRRDKLDVLHAGDHNSPPPFASAALQKVLSMARAQYDVICADLGSSLDLFSIELLRESRRIFLVTTAEVAPVHLAKGRAKSLADLGLSDRVSLVLNRKDHWRTHLESGAVAEAVGMPVAFTIGNDYQTCSEAVLKGSPIPSRSDVGRGMLDLAHALIPNTLPKPVIPARARKFLEFFHVSQIAEPASLRQD